MSSAAPFDKLRARRVFVTGTHTGIGKTLVTAALAWRTGARAMKPLATGFEGMAGSDTEILCRAMGILPTLDITPFRFAAPLSPDMAAAREGRRIDLAALVAACDGVEIVEGIGGVMTPLNERETVLDWLCALGCPAILVAGSYLGTLSHTLTALAAMRARGIAPIAVVVSESENAPALEETAASLRSFVKSVFPLPRIATPNPWKTAPVAGLAAICPLGKKAPTGHGAPP
jgi:dethiobiotin synthetase